MPQSKLLLKRGQIELWESWSSLNAQPLFVVKSPDGVYCFPSFTNTDNSKQALECVKQLGEKYRLKKHQLNVDCL